MTDTRDTGTTPKASETPAPKPSQANGRGAAGRAWDKLGSGPRWRRPLVVTVAVVVLVTVFILVPGYIANQPAFVARYPEYQRPYATWKTSTHSGAACQLCHVPRDVFSQTAYKVRMVGEFYLSLLPIQRQPDLYRTPENANCLGCHVDLRKVSPSGDLNIPHRAHVDQLDIACVTCHKYLVHDKSPEGRHTPTMATCLTCHDGKKAKNSCRACHRDKAVPATHLSPDWDFVHPKAAEQFPAACIKCHGWTPNWCVTCHETKPKSHGKDWRSQHGKRVAENRDCEVCHDAAFCERCHGIVPKLNYDPKVKKVTESPAASSGGTGPASVTTGSAETTSP